MIMIFMTTSSLAILWSACVSQYIRFIVCLARTASTVDISYAKNSSS